MLGIGDSLRDEPRGERERAAAPDRAFDRNLAAHQLDQLTRYREAQTGAAETPCRRRIGLGEALEEARPFDLADADAGVRHRNSQQRR